MILTSKTQYSEHTHANQFFQGIEKRIKRVFNRDVFGTYNGIVEKVNTKNGTLSVRVPDLGNSLYENCKFMVPCSTTTSVIYPNIKVNTQVLITFKMFSLGQPVVLGFQTTQTLSVPIEDNAISIINKNNKIIIKETSITITNGTSSIILNQDGIQLIAPANKITANGEDLTVDDEGAV